MIHPRKVVKRFLSQPTLIKISIIAAVLSLPIGSYSIYTISANGVTKSTPFQSDEVVNDLSTATEKIASNNRNETTALNSDDEQRQSNSEVSPTIKSQDTNRAIISTSSPVPSRPQMEGYKPLYPVAPPHDITLSHSEIIMAPGSTSQSISATFSDTSAISWNLIGPFDYLIASSERLRDYSVVAVIEHSPSDMIRNTIRVHFIASSEARPASYGFSVKAHDYNRGIDVSRHISVRIP